MEDPYTKCGHNPANDSDNYDAWHTIKYQAIALMIMNLPTATDMLPCGDTADKICPPTTQSIKE